jgi:ATP-binding cassette subfamily C protein LapB
MKGNIQIKSLLDSIDKLQVFYNIDQNKVNVLKRSVANQPVLSVNELIERIPTINLHLVAKNALKESDKVTFMFADKNNIIQMSAYDADQTDALYVVEESDESPKQNDAGNVWENFKVKEETAPINKISIPWFLKQFIGGNYLMVFCLGLITNVLLFTVPIFQMNVFDKVMPNGYTGTLIWLIVLAISLLLLWLLNKSVLSYVISARSILIQKSVEKSFMRGFPQAQYEEVIKYKAVLNHLIDGGKSIASLLNPLTVIALIDIPFVVLFLLIMFYLSGNLVFIPIIGMVLVLALSFLLKPMAASFSKNLMNISTSKRMLQSEMMFNFSQIKLANMGQYFINKELISVPGWQSYFKASSLVSNMTTFILFLSLIAVLSFGVLKVVNGNMSTGELVACLIFTAKAISTSRVLPLLLNWSQIAVFFKRHEEFKKVKQEKQDSPLSLSNVTAVALKNLSCYAGEQSILKDINLNLRQDKTTFLFGRPGSGKTTLFNTISGLYQVRSGNILLNNLDHSSFSFNDIRKRIHFSPSGYTFFSGTLLDNLTLSEKHCTPSDIEDVLKRVSMLSTINKLNNALSHKVSGLELSHFSSGESKKIMLARAFLSSADYWILDEPFDCLDDESSIAIAKQMIEFCKERKIGLCLLSNRKKYADMFDEAFMINKGTLFPMVFT